MRRDDPSFPLPPLKVPQPVIDVIQALEARIEALELAAKAKPQ